jgi:hypothetical protein
MAGALAGMALGDAYVNIMGDTAGLASSIARARGMTMSLVTSTGKAVAAGVGAALVAAGGAAIYAMKQFMETEVVSNRLAGAIKLAGGSADVLLPKYEKLADALSRVTKLEDEEVKTAMASALARGLSTEKMEEAVPAAIGLSARLGVGLQTAMNMVTRAGMGNTRMLQLYFPELKNATSATEKWAMVLKIGAAGMDMAKSEVNTLSGAFGQMRKAVSEVFESLGVGLFGGGQLKTMLQAAVDWVWKLKDSVDNLVKGGQFQAWISTAMNVLKSADLGRMIWLSIKIGLLEAINYLIKFARFAVDILTVAFQQGLRVLTAPTFWAGVVEIITGSFMGLGAALLKVFTTPLDYLEAGVIRITELLWQKLGRFGPGGAGYKAKDYETIFKETQEKGLFRSVVDDSAAQAKRLLEAGAANIANAAKEPLTTAMDELADRWGKIMDEKGLFSTDKERSELMALFDPLRAIAVAQAEAAGAGGGKGTAGAANEKAKTEIMSLSAWWGHVQKGVGKDTIEKEQLRAALRTADNTNGLREAIENQENGPIMGDAA